MVKKSNGIFDYWWIALIAIFAIFIFSGIQKPQQQISQQALNLLPNPSAELWALDAPTSINLTSRGINFPEGWFFQANSPGTGMAMRTPDSFEGSYAVYYKNIDGKGFIHGGFSTELEYNKTYEFSAYMKANASIESIINDLSGLAFYSNFVKASAVNFWNPSYYVISVEARGTEFEGWPVMTIQIDGETREFIVNSKELKEYKFPIYLNKGFHTISIGFINDKSAAGVGDRNLYLGNVKSKYTDAKLYVARSDTWAGIGNAYHPGDGEWHRLSTTFKTDGFTKVQLNAFGSSKQDVWGIVDKVELKEVK